MRKIILKTVSSLLAIILITSTFVFSNAATPPKTMPNLNESLSSKEYYSLDDGLYTYKSIEGPDINGQYNVTLEAYTSNISYVSAKYKTTDLLIMVDTSSSMI